MIVIADINRDFNYLKKKILSINLCNDTLIQLGNLSLEKDEDLHNDFLLEINEFLKENNSLLYIMRGNHDNPNFFKKTNPMQSNIKLLSDNSILEFENHKIFILGGGISVDRNERNEKGLYWTDESINIDFQLIENLNGIDMVLTHKPPSYIYDSFLADRFINYWVKGDACLENQLSKERDLLRAFYKKINKSNNIKYWISAHQNLSVQTEIDGIKFISLKHKKFFKLPNKISLF